ncbi:hypothetical protein [Azospirillum sp.]|uniref:hypothetical protein n=1 Tax=Azospirillum sp. TaxID=34012 RepID=UPI002D396BA4|nr:hypothetical protein [Azospirillum sp.]HYD69443.1 hypothetical protein [Azospirillum sp.]
MRLLSLPIILWLLAGGAAMAQQPAPSSMEALRGLLFLGPRDSQGWEGKGEGDAYLLSNTDRGGLIRYVYTLGKSSEAAEAQVTVSVDGKAPGAAGLLYGFDPQRRTYCALMLNADGTLGLYQRGSDSFQRLVSAQGAALRPGANILRIRVERNRLDAFVNGQGVATLASTTVCAGKGDTGIGIIAVSPGRFRFSDFQRR